MGEYVLPTLTVVVCLMSVLVIRMAWKADQRANARKAEARRLAEEKLREQEAAENLRRIAREERVLKEMAALSSPPSLLQSAQRRGVIRPAPRPASEVQAFSRASPRVNHRTRRDGDTETVEMWKNTDWDTTSSMPLMAAGVVVGAAITASSRDEDPVPYCPPSPSPAPSPTYYSSPEPSPSYSCPSPSPEPSPSPSPSSDPW